MRKQCKRKVPPITYNDMDNAIHETKSPCDATSSSVCDGSDSGEVTTRDRTEKEMKKIQSKTKSVDSIGSVTKKDSAEG